MFKTTNAQKINVDESTIKATCQAGNIWVKDIMITARDCKNVHILRGPWVHERVLLGLHNYLQLYLMFEGRAQLEHNSHIVKVGVEATF